MKKFTVVLIAAFLIGSITSDAQVRQRSATKGFNASLSVHTLGWASDYFSILDENAGTGFGGGLRLAYGVTELIEPFINFDFTTIGVGDVEANSFSMSHIDLGVRFNFAGTIHAVRPFAEGAYSFRSATAKEISSGNGNVDLNFSGGSAYLGGGLNYFVSVPFSIFAKAGFTLGGDTDVEINNTKTGDKADLTTFRISIGATLNISELLK